MNHFRRGGLSRSENAWIACLALLLVVPWLLGMLWLGRLLAASLW
jgi:uncharacterized membrane protein